MPLSQDERALAARLLAAGVVPARFLLETLAEVETHARPFADSLRERLASIGENPSIASPWASTVRRPSELVGVPPVPSEEWADEATETRPTGTSGAGSVEIELATLEDATATGLSHRTRYELYGEIGRGGMGRVLRARDREIGREVAVKVLLAGARAADGDLRRFWLEVQATGRLEHPSIVPIHDVGRLPQGEPFYVMKLLRGRTLAELLRGLAAADPSEAETIGVGPARALGDVSRVRLLTAFQQVAYAVAFAHAKGVIHRDIKPANIMIGEFGEVTLIDWGLAKPLVGPPDPAGEGALLASESGPGVITGTPQYISPEAAAGDTDRVGEASDVYSLGAVLYEILTLAPAFADEGVFPTLAKVRAGQFLPPRRRAPDRAISPELDDLVLQAMHVDPAARPTARHLADQIGEILEGTRAREKRHQEAEVALGEGRRAVERWKDARRRLLALDGEIEALVKQIPPHAPIEEKRRLWTREDRARELRIDAVVAFEEAEAAFQRALADAPEHRSAKAALAGLYYDRFLEAERDRNPEAARYYARLVERYDDGPIAGRLVGKGSLELVADDPRTELWLAPFESRDRRLVPGPARSLGRGQISVELPIGSYLVTAKASGRRPTLLPVRIERGGAVRLSVPAITDAALGDGFVLVPGGPAILGGDPVAHGAHPRRLTDVPTFAIGRLPVTCGEYLGFLDALAAVDPDEARRRAPRVRAREGYYWELDPAAGRFVMPTTGPRTWRPEFPVFGVSFEDAEAYARFVAARTGERVRLPHEDEWEKAARGADGRFFPWGDHFDATFCKMKDSRDAAVPEPEPVGAMPADVSPYGVMDLAGGVRELCTSDEGPVMRGGCWHDSGLFCRVAFRHVTRPDFVNTGLGFRIAKDLS